MLSHAFLVVAGQAYVAKFLDTFKEFPPAQRPASFSIDQIQAEMEESFRNAGSGQ